MASLTFRNGPYAGKSLQIPQGKSVTMGRNRDIELPLPDLKLSRKHCMIECGLAGYILRDMGSTNGTYLNGQRLQGEANLRHYDRITVGDTDIEFQCPEDIADQSTRVGVPDPNAAPVSQALEPVTNAEGVAQQPTLQGLQGIKPALAPIQPQLPEEDPLALSLRDLDLPLPADPAAAAEQTAERPRLLFCDACNGSIPILDLDLNVAKEIGGKLYCRECLAQGISIGPEVPATPPPTTVAPTRALAAAASSDMDLDDILKGLGNVEEIPVDDAPPRPASIVAMGGKLQVPGGSTRRFTPAVAAQGPKLPPPQVKQAEITEFLGEEFEEIGAQTPPPPGAAKPAAGRAGGPAKPPPPTRPPAIDEDDDLIEIGGSGPA